LDADADKLANQGIDHVIKQGQVAVDLMTTA
jgi:hypothetical protein